MTPTSHKTALVTGASSGMGKEIARRLLADGLTVYVAARRVAQMADLAGAGAIVLEMDITSEAQITAAVEAIAQGHGGVDVLVNNAGFGKFGPVEETSIEDARRQFEVNLFGLARLTQLLLPAMRAKGSGMIVNISSMGGKIYTPLGAWYHATKHALEGWSDSLRLELKAHGIDVVVVQPGLIDTGFLDAVESHFSGDEAGPYGGLIGPARRASAKAYEGGRASPPSVVAEVVSRAVHARRPRTRYAVGAMARPSLAARWLLGDRAFDRLVTGQLR